MVSESDHNPKPHTEPSVARQALYVVLVGGSWLDRNRGWNRAWCACAVCAPPPSNRAHRAPVATWGGGGVVRSQRRAVTAAQDRTTPSSLLAGCHVIQQERPQPFLGMSRPTSADLRAPAGRSQAREGSHGVVLPFRSSEEEDLRQLWRTLRRPDGSVPAGHARGGSGAARPQGALRAFDSSARPRFLVGLRSAPPAAAI